MKKELVKCEIFSKLYLNESLGDPCNGVWNNSFWRFIIFKSKLANFLRLSTFDWNFSRRILSDKIRFSFGILWKKTSTLDEHCGRLAFFVHCFRRFCISFARVAPIVFVRKYFIGASCSFVFVSGKVPNFKRDSIIFPNLLS